MAQTTTARTEAQPARATERVQRSGVPASAQRGAASGPPVPPASRVYDEVAQAEARRRLVQRAAETRAFASDPGQVHEAARAGLRASAGPLPFGGVIQRAFGRHGVGGVRAHRGPLASAGAGAMGAAAYTQGEHVVLGGGTDLRTVAHEAAHVVQQRAGVKVPGGVGQVGDPYERHAEAVAQRVVSGDSAEDLLDRTPGGGGAGAVVQRAVGFEFQCRNWQVQDRGGQQVESGKGEHAALAKGNGWYMMSDGGDPEFVVNHVAETDPEALATPMGEITAYADNISKKQGRQLLKGNRIVPRGAPEAAVTADPQVTAGVRYERLPAFMTMLADRDPYGGSQSEANRNLMQNTQVSHYTGDDLKIGKALRQVRDQLAKPQFATTLAPPLAPDEVEGAVGVMALLTTYVIKGPRLGHAYIKDFPLLSKSNLARVVTNSPLSLLSRDQLEKVYLVIILAAGRDNSHEQIYDPGKLGSPKPKEDGPTIEQWLESLLYDRKDLLSFTQNRDFADNSMGNLARVEQVGPDGGLAPILEMRRINQSLPYPRWAPFTASVIDWMAGMNDMGAVPADYQPPQ